jgi:Ca2+/Na+ antiporter
MQRTIIIITLCLLGIFVHPFDPGLLDFIYRFIIYAIVVYLIYITYQQNQEDFQEKSIAEPIAVDQETAPNIEQLNLNEDWQLESLIRGDEKTKNFLIDQFEILTNLIFPDNGWIFYKQNEKIVPFHFKAFSETKVDNLSSQYPVSGLIQILDEKGDIVIENNLDDSKNLLIYYQDSEYSAGSFIGLPVILTTDQKIFFTFDSHLKDHINREDLPIFTKLIKNVAVWIDNRIKAYILLTQLKLQEKLLVFAKQLNSCKTVAIAIEQFAVLISNEFEASRLTISIRQKGSEQALIKKVVGQRDDFDENITFPLDEGLSGWVISKNKPYLIDDLEKGEYFIPRYNKDEKSNFGLRSFLGIPIDIENEVIGAVTLEHRIANKYNENDKKRLLQFVEILSSTFLRTTTTTKST